MNIDHPIKLSMLDLVPVREGASISDALWQAQRTAQHVEQLGFMRYWVAEHHNLQGVASSATAVLVGQIASGTQRIRVGSGGIMLPNHAPLTVAEAFGTLAELYPGRIDLGLGRAPGTDPTTMRALRRDRVETKMSSRDVRIAGVTRTTVPGQRVVALPGQVRECPRLLDRVVQQRCAELVALGLLPTLRPVFNEAILVSRRSGLGTRCKDLTS